MGYLWVILIGVNVSLALFNLLPIPPLDGASVLVGVLSAIRQPWANGWVGALEQLETQAPMAFILLIMANQALQGRIFGTILGRPISLIMNLLV